MSFSKKDQVFQPELNAKIRAIIAEILRKEYAELGSPLKRIGKKIQVNTRTIKNWYGGYSAPNLVHFIALARMSPSLVVSFLKLSGYDDLARVLADQTMSDAPGEDSPDFRFYGITFDTIKMRKDPDVI